MKKVSLTVNSRPVQVVAHGKDTVLLDLVRDELGLIGTKQSCDKKGQCGTCMVLVDGKAVLSCITKVEALDGAEVTTIEGLGTPDRPNLDPAGVRPGRRRPVRLLHPGDDRHRRRAAPSEPGPDPGRGEARPASQPVPLHRLREDRRWDPAGREVHPRRGAPGRLHAGRGRPDDRDLLPAPVRDGQGHGHRDVRRRHPDAGCARDRGGPRPARPRPDQGHRHLCRRGDAGRGGRHDGQGHPGHEPAQVPGRRPPHPVRHEGQAARRRDRDRGGGDEGPGARGRRGRQGGLRGAAGARHAGEGHGRGRAAAPRRAAQPVLPAADHEGRCRDRVRQLGLRGDGALSDAVRPSGPAGARGEPRLDGGRGRGCGAGRGGPEHQHPPAHADAPGGPRLGEHPVRGAVRGRPVRHQGRGHHRGHRRGGRDPLQPPGALCAQPRRVDADRRPSATRSRSTRGSPATPRASSPRWRWTSPWTTART